MPVPVAQISHDTAASPVIREPWRPGYFESCWHLPSEGPCTWIGFPLLVTVKTDTFSSLSKAGSIPQAGLCFGGLHVTLKLSSGGREWGALSLRCRPPVELHCEMEVSHPHVHFSFSRNSILLIPVPTDLPLAPPYADLKFRFLLLAIGFQFVVSFSFETLLQEN